MKKKRAFAAAHGTVRKLFRTGAACLNKNCAFVGAVSRRTAQENFTKLFSVFEFEAGRDRGRSRLGGKLNEADRIPALIVDYIEQWKKLREIKREVQFAATKRVVEAHARLLALANGVYSDSEALASKFSGAGWGPKSFHVDIRSGFARSKLLPPAKKRRRELPTRAIQGNSRRI